MLLAMKESFTQMLFGERTPKFEYSRDQLEQMDTLEMSKKIVQLLGWNTTMVIGDFVKGTTPDGMPFSFSVLKTGCIKQLLDTVGLTWPKDKNRKEITIDCIMKLQGKNVGTV